ncbi:MAG TPA: ribosome silencing factor [Thermoanaerobaculia bacterium]|jgi:ribosome-associated protein|nr:ribosome silencing factor [Thermoanaerobaculia bacterium]
MTTETKTAPLPVLSTTDRVRAAVAAADGRQAVDLRVLHLGKVSDFTEYFVVCGGTNERQVQAIADAVEMDLRSLGVRPLHIEGLQRGQWVLLDYGDLIVHAFLDEPRHYYALERLWSDAPDVTAEFRAPAAGAAASDTAGTATGTEISPP